MLDLVLKRLIRRGHLVLVDGSGKRKEYGDPREAGDQVSRAEPLTLHIHDKSVAWKIALNPDPGFAEAYMDGRLSFTGGRIWDFLELVGRNVSGTSGTVMPASISRALGFLMRTIHQINPATLSRRNVAHHYDLSGALYDLFLDQDRQYSCAYFPQPDVTLEAAQAAKKHHIANKLLLKSGMQVLDIGCGWGGMALSIAKQVEGVHVLGITLSTEQLAVAQKRAEEEGLSDRVKFQLIDYRDVKGQFDRIVSVGMFEHVGVPQYQVFFDKVQSLLTDDGVALIHSIGRNDRPGITSPFIRKYIFPGGYIPALSEVTPRIEKTHLWMTDIEILRLHYAETIKHWRHRFLQNWDKAEAIYDARFCRMWEFYLAASEMSFRYDTLMVFQIQLSKQLETVPLTRDYMYARDA
ncbi:MAG: cyclopropane-fatty-acyl-phospholipid synthase [Alphaproteobacteria bacterium]|nr:cyclopropane-fatty-acyl-phospholipid synthase [Alphaproteobacteria bacterium]